MFPSIALLLTDLADIITIVRAYSCILPPLILYRRLWKSPVDLQPRLLISLDRGRCIYHRRFHTLEKCAVGNRGGIQLHCIVCTANFFTPDLFTDLIQLLLVVQRRSRMACRLRWCPYYLESLMLQMIPTL